MLSSVGGKGRAEGVERRVSFAFAGRCANNEDRTGQKVTTSLHSRRTMRTPIQSPLVEWRGGGGRERRAAMDGERPRIDNDPTFQRNLLPEYVAETECERNGGWKWMRAKSAGTARRYGDLHSKMQTFLVNN